MRHGIFSDLPRELPAASLVVVNDTRVATRAACACAGRVEARPRCCFSSEGTAACGRPSRGRRGGCARACGSAQSSSSSSSARPLAACGSRASPPARRRCRRTSTSRSTTPSATRPSTPTSPARPPRRRPACTSRRSCSAALDVERVTLHVGLDTFRPVTAERARGHPLHGERYRVEHAGVGGASRGGARRRGRNDDGPRARDARARRRRSRAARSSS